MLIHVRNWILAGLVGLVLGCSGGGGGDSAPGVEPGPPPPGQPVPPPPVQPGPTAYEEAEVLNATITSVTLDEANRPIVDWQLSDGNGVAIIDLTAEDVRFTIAKLQASPLGNLTGEWQSYINQIEDPNPERGDGTEPRIQATYERNADGATFTNNGDGTYTYHFEQSLSEQPEDILAEAEAEGLNLDFEPDRTHRMAMQFGNSAGWANPIYDWIPASGATQNLFNMDISATENCNRCHDPLRYHGSGRREVEYCVTCHNPGTFDPSSTNTVNMKVMIHKIHMGENLPSVQEGGEYGIDGNDYSHIVYPQDIRNCVSCHVGTGTEGDREDLVVTSQGDNWAEVPSRAACGSCHDLVIWEDHQDGQTDDLNCANAGCHDSNSVIASHLIPSQEARENFEAEIISVENTGAGETPVATFRVFNPVDETDYDILNDPVWTDSSSRLRVRFAWDNTDYNNTGNAENDANSVAADAKEDAIPNGDGSYRISPPIPIPDNSVEPGIAATGSGTAVIEGRAVVEFEPGESGRVPLTNVHESFSIDEVDGEAQDRREPVPIEKCQACHVTLSFHGGSRTDNVTSCATCHNPRNTDREDREELETPPIDGLKEQSVDLKVMIHGIHAAGFREVPLQVEEEVFDEEHVQYPGNLANCETCHDDDSFALPLAGGVLATSVDTGDDRMDPADDTVATPVSSVCSSCHDGAEAKAHMEEQGGNFATTQTAIDNGDVVETCSVCHGEGRANDAWAAHQRFLD
jgi:OmcA/MtrC family decaheme c-type cytochrome